MAIVKNRAYWILKAELALEAGRFEDMALPIKQAIIMGANLNLKERNLLSVAFKNIICRSRLAWRSLSTNLSKIDALAPKRIVATKYKQTIEKEIRDTCQEMLNLLNFYLLPATKKVEAQVFYLKKKGDYCRYLAEIARPVEMDALIECAKMAYESAIDLANEYLQPVHRTRLGLALNYAVFCHKIIKSPMLAFQFAGEVFREALAHLDTLNVETYRDSTFILQLIHDNLVLWESGVLGNNGGAGDQADRPQISEEPNDGDDGREAHISRQQHVSQGYERRQLSTHVRHGYRQPPEYAHASRQGQGQEQFNVCPRGRRGHASNPSWR